MRAPTSLPVEALHFKLSMGERASPLWLRMRAHLELLLESERRKNDGNLDPQETARVRGRISMLKQVIDFSVDLPPIETADHD